MCGSFSACAGIAIYAWRAIMIGTLCQLLSKQVHVFHCNMGIAKTVWGVHRLEKKGPETV